MATRLYGISIGEGEFDVTEGAGSATSADNVELTVDVATSIVGDGTGTRAPSRQEVIDAIDKIKNHIMKKNWPPA